MTIQTSQQVLDRMSEHYPRQRGLDYFEARATSLAEQIRQANVGAVVLEPGNASRIELVVTDLFVTPLPTAYGQRFLVAIPNFAPARCAVLSRWVDEYVVASNLKLLDGDAPYVALVLGMAFEALS